MTNFTLQGISNCDSVKKAKQWLTQNDIAYVFRDYKKQPPTLAELAAWADQVGWENLLNKRGTTWRKLSPAQQQDINQDKALALMQDQTSLIKRPLLISSNQALLGFSVASYQGFFAK